MHDRRIDGKPHTFGNEGILYMNAMTWYDHETERIWTQPTGTALQGFYTGRRLEMVPAQVVPWGTWKAEHPETLVLEVSGQFGIEHDPFGNRLETYVLGVVVKDTAKAYRWEAASRLTVVNDRIGDLPVVVYADPESRSAHVFVRRIGSDELEFGWRGGSMFGKGTESRWNPASGIAESGPLSGTRLREVPYSTAFDWAWRDFYPQSAFFGD